MRSNPYTEEERPCPHLLVKRYGEMGGDRWACKVCGEGYVPAERLAQVTADRDHWEGEYVDACKTIEAVRALADQWDETPDYTPSAYDQGRVDQRHEMTMQLLAILPPTGEPT